MELSYFCCPIFGLKYRCWCEISADVVYCPFAEPQEAPLFVTQYINPGSRETKLYFLIKQNDKNQLILHCRWKCGVAVNCLCNLPNWKDQAINCVIVIVCNYEANFASCNNYIVYCIFIVTGAIFIFHRSPISNEVRRDYLLYYFYLWCPDHKV